MHVTIARVQSREARLSQKSVSPVLTTCDQCGGNALIEGVPYADVPKKVVFDVFVLIAGVGNAPFLLCDECITSMKSE